MARLKNEKYLIAFAQHLRNLREGKKITLWELGRHSGLGLATVQRIETANINITLVTLCAIAKGLKVHPKELLDFEHSESITL
jgi:transcriptional regulator with XRE-family HTH domain